MIVIADTTPINYLVLIDRADLLPQLFGPVLIPPAVFNELQEPETPELVREWVAKAPSWLRVQCLRSRPDPSLDHLDSGEREAIALAEEVKADQLLIDEADARREAARESGVHGHTRSFTHRRPTRPDRFAIRSRPLATDHVLRRSRIDPFPARGRRRPKKDIVILVVSLKP